jgi:predicted RNA-binding Zn-ribbon protein involved in translation (DUF1610 family)
MYVPCPKCQADVWLETHWDCPKCGAAMRRCVDCRHYDAERSFCGVLDGQVSAQQAREPSRLSVSYHCTSYERVPGAMA